MYNEMYLFSVSQNGQLRAWCCSRGQCLSVTDVSDKRHPRVLGGQKHVIRKTVNSRGDLMLGIYFCYSEQSHIVIIEPRLESGLITYDTHKSIFFLENHDLVEMILSDRGQSIWCVWVTGAGESAISHSTMNNGTWSWAILEPQPPPDLPIDPTLDPRQTYLDAIFKPGLFTTSDITKALTINRRGISDLDQTDLSLRQQVCMMVGSEIITEASHYELTDEEYLDVAHRCWSRLYSCCVQYHQTGTPALSLLAMPNSMVVIKKSQLSLLRPLDYLESSMSESSQNQDNGESVLLQRNGESLLLQLLMTIAPEDEAISRIDKVLHLQSDLDQPIEDIIGDMCLDDVEKLIEDHSNKILPEIASMLKILNDADRSIREESVCLSLRSELGLSIIISTSLQIIQVRLGICRCLLVLLKLIKDQPASLWDSAETTCRLLWTQLRMYENQGQLVLRQFVLHKGLTQHSILKSANILAHYTWPRSPDGCGKLAQHLLESKEHLLLQELARLMPSKPWQLLVIQSLLETGEAYKAYDLCVLEGADIPYYIQMIKLFEEYNCPDIVLNLTNLAINQASPDDPYRPMLYSVSFMHHLALGHYEDAYESLEANPEEERRENCLRDLVVALVNTRQLRLLLDLPYTGMLSKLESLLQDRARTREPTAAAIYYNVLYSLHIKYMNFRKAASVMLEQGLRAESADVQQQSYLVCLNALSLVEPNFAWIVKPTGQQEDTIEVWEVKDVRREYHLASARSKLRNCSTDTTAEEVIAQCVASGHYKIALRLCHLCGVSYRLPLETLTVACVQIQDNDKAWEWLHLNEILDLVAGDANATTVAWRLLKCLLDKYEEDGHSTLHKAVAAKLMSLSVFLPQWLQSSYKKRNSAELMRLYLSHGDLVQASELACELLSAALGRGKEHFGLTHALVSTAPPLCLPFNTIDMLLFELSHHKMDGELRQAVDGYIETCKRVSEDKITSMSM